MFKVIKQFKAAFGIDAFIEPKLKSTFDILFANDLYEENNLQSVRLVHAKFESKIVQAIAMLHSASLLNQVNFNVIIHQLPHVFEALEILHKEKILNQDNFDAVVYYYWCATNIATAIYLNNLLVNFANLVENRNKSNLQWFSDIFRKSYRIANMEFSIATTYEYVKSLTEYYIETNLSIDSFNGKSINRTLSHPSQYISSRVVKLQTCCVCGVTDADKLVTLACGHNYHTDCMNLGVKSYLAQERIDKIGVCLYESCTYKLQPKQFAEIIKEPDTIVAIQRLLIRSIDGVLFCPSCPNGVAKERVYLGYAYKCSSCSIESCFACGNKPHLGITCAQANDYAVDLKFLHEIIARGEQEYFGKCPHCKVTVGKHDGCDVMRCGRDTEMQRIKSHVGNGCGKQFDWKNRIKVEDWLSVYSESNIQPIPDFMNNRLKI